VTEGLHATDLPGNVAWVAERLGLVGTDGSVRTDALRAISVGDLLDAGFMNADQLGAFMTDLSRHLDSDTTSSPEATHPGTAPAQVRRRRTTGPSKADARRELSASILGHLLLCPGSTVDEVARALGEDLTAVTAAAGPVDWLILAAHELADEGQHAESAAVAATRTRALAALQAASMLVAPLSHQNYTSLVREGRVAGPSVARIVQLFGSWTSACSEAGVRSGDVLRRHYSRTWSREDAIGHVSSYLLEPAYRGASNRYDEWRAGRGQGSTPSLGTVRNLCGTRWNDIRTTALRSMRSRWAAAGTLR
jgi:hypothetical protein